MIDESWLQDCGVYLFATLITPIFKAPRLASRQNEPVSDVTGA